MCKFLIDSSFFSNSRKKGKLHTKYFSALITDPELQQLSDYESVPRLSLPSERIGFVHPDKVKVRAECHDTGMNVSFHIDGRSEVSYSLLATVIASMVFLKYLFSSIPVQYTQPKDLNNVEYSYARRTTLRFLFHDRNTIHGATRWK